MGRRPRVQRPTARGAGGSAGCAPPGSAAAASAAGASRGRGLRARLGASVARSRASGGRRARATLARHFRGFAKGR
eukprot:15441458-Alexandrium_andersonii.AAC.1